MRTTFLLALALVLTLIFAGSGYSQCAGGRCAVPPSGQGYYQSSGCQAGGSCGTQPTISNSRSYTRTRIIFRGRGRRG